MAEVGLRISGLSVPARKLWILIAWYLDLYYFLQSLNSVTYVGQGCPIGAMAYYCEQGTHRSVHQCLLDKCILQSMGFEVEVVDLCRWHHLVQGCSKETKKVCDDCQRDNPLSVMLRKFGVMEFFECVELADSLCSDSFP